MILRTDTSKLDRRSGAQKRLLAVAVAVTVELEQLG